MWVIPEASDEAIEASGEADEASGKADEASGKADEASGKADEASGETIEASTNVPELVGLWGITSDEAIVTQFIEIQASITAS